MMAQNILCIITNMRNEYLNLSMYAEWVRLHIITLLKKCFEIVGRNAIFVGTAFQWFIDIDT